MKKTIGVILMLIAVLTVGVMTSCSSGGSGEVKYSDEDFMKSLAKGLEARWDISDKLTEEGDNTVQGFKDCIQAELDQVEQYQNATFEDSVLQEKALAYINILKESMDNVEYAVSDTDYQKWSDIYDQRTMMIKDFADNYGLTVDSKHQKWLDDLVANGKTAGENADKKAAVEKIVKDLKFEVVEDEGYGWKTYEAVFENTTDYDIKDLSVDVSLLDADGVIVETGYTNADNISKGQKAKLSFSTDKEFDRYEPVLNYFDAN